MSNPFISFAIKTVILLTVVFAIHLLVLNVLQLPLFENRIVLSYIVNLVLVIVIFGILYLLKEKYKIEAKLAMRGLGEASIIVGEK